MKNNLPFLVLSLCMLATGCEKDDSDRFSKKEDLSLAYQAAGNGGTNTGGSQSKITAPTLVADVTTTTTREVNFRCSWNNGGDKGSNMSCTVHWKSYGKKPSSQPSKSELTKSEAMRQYSGTTATRTVFNKTHVMSGGESIYYYYTCRNSKGSVETGVRYTYVKR